MAAPTPDHLGIPLPTALNFALNQEAKILLAGVLAESPNTHSTPNLTAAMIGRQGDDPAWFFQEGGINGYCKNSLLPAGAATQIDRRVWQMADEQKPQSWLQMVGCMGAWSLRWDESIQNLFGKSISLTDERAPWRRWTIYRALLTADEPVSISDLALFLHTSDMCVQNHATRLAARGILQITEKRNNPNPTLHVRRTTHPRPQNAKPAIRALYAVLGEVGQGNSITLKELMERTLAKDPDNKKYLRQRLSVMMADPCGPIEETSPAPSARRTRVVIAETAREPIADLVDGITAIQKGQDPGYADEARRILHDPVAFRQLIAKAYQHAKNGHASKTSDQTE